MRKYLIRPDYYYIPSVVAESVKPHEAFVWSVVYWFEKMKDGRCTASNERIAEALPYKSTGVSVANALVKLEKEGLIVRFFADETRRIRKEIKVTVEIVKVSPTDDTGITHRLYEVSPTGEQKSKSKRVKEILTSNAGALRDEEQPKRSDPERTNATYNPLGAQVIKAFEDVDIANKRYYGNTTQRAACDWLIEQYGLELVLARIAVLRKTNTMLYFPRIYSPVQLRDKWQRLEDKVTEKRQEITSKKSTVAFS